MPSQLQLYAERFSLRGAVFLIGENCHQLKTMHFQVKVASATPASRGTDVERINCKTDYQGYPTPQVAAEALGCQLAINGEEASNVSVWQHPCEMN